MIYGIGIDIVEVSRFESAVRRRGERIFNRLFTETELKFCLAKRSPLRHLAARFAAKVSFFKAMNRPWKFKDVEITRDDNGMPGLMVKGLDKDLRVSVSITHDGDLSLAETVVEKI